MASLLALIAAILSAKSGPAPTARIAIVPDVQNYVTTIDPGDDGVRVQLLDAMVRDIVAWKPDFVVQVGDLTDSTGGVDQGTTGWLDDDPNTQGRPNDAEWRRIRTSMFDRFDAARIPHLEVVGNHDSGVDYGRYFPAAEFQARPYFYALLARKPAWSDPIADTTQRAALMPTPIGTICAIGLPFEGQRQAGVDTSWLVATIGCGAGRPTLLVQHGGLSGPVLAALSRSPAETRALVIASAEGHFTCTGCVMMSQAPYQTAGLENALRLRANWQETSFGPPGGTHHTGLSWWAQWTLDPNAGTSTLTARNPYLGVSRAPLDAGYRNQNGAIALPFSGCARFSCAEEPAR